jgi:hypothetical protein
MHKNCLGYNLKLIIMKTLNLLLPILLLAGSGGNLKMSNTAVGKNAGNITSGKLIFTTEACGGNSDNKDHDTHVYVEVYGINGNIIATENYTDDVEFPDDGSTREIPLNIGDPNSPGLQITSDMLPVQKIKIVITPNGHDTWTFDHITAAFDGDSGAISYNLNACVLVSQDRTTAIVVSNPPNDWVQYP